MIVWPAKDPLEVLDYTWPVPVDDGDSVATITVSRVGGSATLDSQTLTGGSIRCWISGGAADELSYFALTAVTVGGRTFRETAVLPVIDRAAELLATFRLRYPAFSSVEDGPISYWLVSAATVVGDKWPEAVRAPAKAAYAAHRMAEAGQGKGAVPAGVTSFKSGTFSATVADGIASLTGLDATVYGREFVALRRTAFAGPRLAWTPR